MVGIRIGGLGGTGTTTDPSPSAQQSVPGDGFIAAMLAALYARGPEAARADAMSAEVGVQLAPPAASVDATTQAPMPATPEGFRTSASATTLVADPTIPTASASAVAGRGGKAPARWIAAGARAEHVALPARAPLDESVKPPDSAAPTRNRAASRIMTEPTDGVMNAAFDASEPRAQATPDTPIPAPVPAAASTRAPSSTSAGDNGTSWPRVGDRRCGPTRASASALPEAQPVAVDPILAPVMLSAEVSATTVVAATVPVLSGGDAVEWPLAEPATGEPDTTSTGAMTAMPVQFAAVGGGPSATGSSVLASPEQRATPTTDVFTVTPNLFSMSGPSLASGAEPASDVTPRETRAPDIAKSLRALVPVSQPVTPIAKQDTQPAPHSVLQPTQDTKANPDPSAYSVNSTAKLPLVPQSVQSPVQHGTGVAAPAGAGPQPVVATAAGHEPARAGPTRADGKQSGTARPGRPASTIPIVAALNSASANDVTSPNPDPPATPVAAHGTIAHIGMPRVAAGSPRGDIAASVMAQTAADSATTATEPPSHQAARAITALRVPAGATQPIAIDLHPVALGQLVVRISRSSGGTSNMDNRIEITASRADTLALLHADAPVLHRALDAAGFASAGRDLSFQLAAPDAGPAGAGTLNFGQPGTQDRSGRPDTMPGGASDGSGPGLDSTQVGGSGGGAVPIRRMASALGSLDITA